MEREIISSKELQDFKRETKRARYLRRKLAQLRKTERRRVRKAHWRSR